MTRRAPKVLWVSPTAVTAASGSLLTVSRAPGWMRTPGTSELVIYGLNLNTTLTATTPSTGYIGGSNTGGLTNAGYMGTFNRPYVAGESASTTLSFTLATATGRIAWAVCILIEHTGGLLSNYAMVTSNSAASTTLQSDYLNLNVQGAPEFLTLGVTVVRPNTFSNPALSSTTTGVTYPTPEFIAQPVNPNGTGLVGAIWAAKASNPNGASTVNTKAAVTVGADTAGAVMVWALFTIGGDVEPRISYDASEASGNVLDKTGGGRDLVPAAGATRVADRIGMGGKALSGGGEWQNLSAAFGSYTGLTIEAWYQHNGSTADKGLVTLVDHAAGADRAALYVNGGKPGMWVDAGGFVSMLTNFAMTNGTWYHLVGVWTGRVIQVYVNGVLQPESAAQVGTFTASISGLWFNENASGGGALTQVRVYNRPIFHGEVVRNLMTPVTWAGSSAVTPQFPTVPDPTGRFLVDSGGNAVMMYVGAAWQAFLTLQPNFVDGYLSARAYRGFNALYVTAVRSDQDHSTGVTPFTDAALTPNESYWALWDTFLSQAEAYGITIMSHIVTTWNPDGSSAAAYTAASDAQCYAFGQWLGNRYKTRPNVQWLFGGDWALPHDSTLVSRVKNIIDGIRSTGDEHAVIFHETEESIGLADSTLTPYATLAAPYSYTPTYFRTRLGYASGKPSVMIEANYEFENNNYTSFTTTAETLRRQAMWSMTTGQMGHSYGAGLTYNFTDPAWMGRMDTAALEQLARFNARVKSLPWSTLVPDTGNTVITSGRGTERTAWVAEDVLANDFATAAYSPDGTTILAYFPTARTATISLARLGANRVYAVIDPSTNTVVQSESISAGQTSLSMPLSSYGTHADGTSDWLVLLTGDAISAAPPFTVIQGGVAVPASAKMVVGGALVDITVP